MFYKKKRSLKKQRLTGGGPGFSKSKPQHSIENKEEKPDKPEKPNNTVTFNPISRKRKSYDDKYDIDNISDNSEEEEITDKSTKRKRKKGKKWSTKMKNKSGRSVDMKNRMTLNKFRKTKDDENMMNFVTGKITREEYDTNDVEIKKQTNIGGKKKRKTTRRKGNKLRTKYKKTNRV